MSSTGPEDTVVRTERLVLRPWTPQDAEQALTIFGDAQVARWLVPALDRVPDAAAMRAVIERWAEEPVDVPSRRWAVQRADGGDGQDAPLVGAVAVRRLPPEREDFEIAWQIAPDHWGNGYATEAARAALLRAFEEDVHEVLAVMRPGNDRSAALAQRLGMTWVGETDKYYDLHLQVYRVRPPELT